MNSPKFSVIILTYNRERYLSSKYNDLFIDKDIQTIIVDNNSDTDYVKKITAKHTNIIHVQNKENLGAVGRSEGMKLATGKYVITLDDDVWGIDHDDLQTIETIFTSDPRVSCINFKVLDETTNSITNWSHHRDKSTYSEISFKTYEISEGACVFRNSDLIRTEYYPLHYFISHEGPDLAFQLLKLGTSIIYEPSISVFHAHAPEGRTNWRRYYFDTRNLIWLAFKHYNKRLLVKRLPIQLTAMFIYSIRDGYLKYFCKAIYDGIVGIKTYNITRLPVSKRTYGYICETDKHRPSLIFYIKERLLKRNIRI